ncbi:hypothetical protein HXY32_03125 [Candidatus Bathyarchaeota archaeon]|nr:hypothetical protein [Candidatus Bathyarchaeota archaeon]
MHVPSRNTGRGVHNCGKPKGFKPVSTGKPTSTQPAQAGKVRGLKGPEVTVVRLETGRSSPGQGEARRKPSGGSKGC